MNRYKKQEAETYGGPGIVFAGSIALRKQDAEKHEHREERGREVESRPDRGAGKR
jgi:hypothetical protein